MTTTFRAWIFACFYFGVLLFMAVICLSLRGLPEVHTWGPFFLGAFAIPALPWIRAKIEISDEGIVQTIVRRRFIKWSDVMSWERVDAGSEGPETIKIITRLGSVTLNHNCVYGKRLDFVESELRRRVAQRDGAANGSLPVAH